MSRWLSCIQIRYGCSLGISNDLTNFWDESIKQNEDYFFLLGVSTRNSNSMTTDSLADKTVSCDTVPLSLLSVKWSMKSRPSPVSLVPLMHQPDKSRGCPCERAAAAAA